MQQTPATPDEVRELLADVDDLIVELIVRSSASPDEITEALRSLGADDLVGQDVDFALSSRRVIEVRTIMTQTALAEDDEEDEGVPTFR